MYAEKFFNIRKWLHDGKGMMTCHFNQIDDK